MKKGFTLSELLITLGIIGVVAALATPTLVKLKPDDAKGKFLKAHNVLSNMTADIVSDSSLYMTDFNDLGQPTCAGIGCNEIPDYIDNEDASDLIGNVSSGAKFGALLALRLNVDKDDVTKTSTGVTFTTTDGIEWEITSNSSNVSVNGYSLTTEENEVVIDINGEDKGKNCEYSTSCKTPDQFKFKVDTYGNVSAEDAMGKAYLKNSSNMKANDEDRDEAKKLLGEK